MTQQWSAAIQHASDQTGPAHLVLDAGLLLAGVAVLALPPALAAHFSCMSPRAASVMHTSAAVCP